MRAASIIPRSKPYNGIDVRICDPTTYRLHCEAVGKIPFTKIDSETRLRLGSHEDIPCLIANSMGDVLLAISLCNDNEWKFALNWKSD